MAIVTGDRYLEQLVKFVEKEASSLVDGSTVLKLNPVGLHYVHTRFEALHELENLLTGAPVDYLRAYVSDLGDHRALEQLRRMLRIIPSLKVVSVIPYPARDPTPLSLVPFGRLRVLELRCCDLSTSAAKGLLELRNTLEKIVCYNSTDAVRHVVASRIADIKSSPQWHRLNYASFACNRLVLMDESLQLLPSIDTLDLSRNHFSKIDNLCKCTKLKNLDLGYNRLRTILPLREISCNLVKLIIRNNALSSLRGLENLKSLEGLDVSYNILSNFSELDYISGQQNLQNLWLEGNPLSCSRWYRAHVFSYFAHPGIMKLDGKNIGTREFWKRQIIVASNYRLHSSYGFYLPAKENSKEKGGTQKKKRKTSRLASIESDDDSISLPSDEESASYGHQKDINEFMQPNDKRDIDSLMSKVESMKKDGTIHWLRDFRSWIEHKSGLMVDRSSEEPVLVQVTKPFDFVNKATCDFSLNTLKHHESPTDKISANSKNTCVQDASNDFQRTRIDSVKSKTSVDCSKRPLAAVYRKESTSSRHQSPPHYQDDILQKRHNLAAEIFQDPLLSHSIESSDSNQTSSEDEYDLQEVCPLFYEGSGLKDCEFFSSDLESNVSGSVMDSPSPYTHKEVAFIKMNGELRGGHVVDKKNKSRKNLISLEEHAISNDKAHVDSDVRIGICDSPVNSESKLLNSFDENHLLSGVMTATEQALVPESTIEEYFKEHIGDANVNETCKDYVHCDCVLEPQSLFREREVIFMVSSESRFYVLLISIAFDGSGHLILLDSLKNEDIQEIIVGFGLQVIRIFIAKGATYLFRTGSISKSRHLLSLLHILDGSEVKQAPRFTSLELVQVDLFEKEICAGLAINIFQYSLVHFGDQKFEEESWLTRSLFIAGGQLIICVEDFKKFSSSLCASSVANYYSLDSCCFIRGLSELVVETQRCISTLTLQRAATKTRLSSKEKWHSESVAFRGSKAPNPVIWKLKWYSEEGLTNFVTIVKAIHADVSSNSLVVRYLP